MQDKEKWYIQYKVQLVISVIVGVIAAIYKVIKGSGLHDSAFYGLGIAFFAFLGLILLLGVIEVVEGSDKKTADTLDRFIKENEFSEKNVSQTGVATSFQETFEVPGAYYHRTSIAKVANLNPDWRKTCKTLVKAGKVNKKIYRFERTTKAAELVEEPDNRHDKNAVMVKIDGETVGYISTEENLHVKDILKNKQVEEISATITGGEYKTIISEEQMIKDKTGPYVTVKIRYR